jgi:hypothetical protein
MKRIVLIVAGMSAVLAAAQARAPEDRYANIRSVEIVSALGDTLVLRQEADLLGADAPDTLFDTGLHIDDVITRQIVQAIGMRFVLMDGGSIDPALLSRYQLPDATQAALRARDRNNQVPDAIILVHADRFQLRYPPPFVMVTASFSGLSLTRTNGLFGVYTTEMSDQYAITVIDAHTGQELGSGVALLPPTGIFGAQPRPLLDCHKFWPSLPQPTPAEADQLRADVMGTIQMTLPNALWNAGLTPSGNMSWMTDWNGVTMRCGKFD